MLPALIAQWKFINYEEMKISETLANLRRERKMTVRALAQATGLNISNISLIETGKRIPQIDTLIKILDALDAELMIT